MAPEQFKGGAGRSAETIDGLIGIADREHVPSFSGQLLDDLHLGEIGILKLVDQDEAGMLPLSGQHLRIAVQQFVGMRDHLAEGAQVVLSQHALDGSEHPGDLLAASHHFLMAELGRVLRLAHSRDVQLATTDTTDVFGILLRLHQFVLAAAHEIEQVEEELADVGGADEVIEVQLPDAATQVDPEIGILEQAELLAAAGQQLVAVGMKSLGLQFRDVGPAQLGRYPLAHLAGGVIGVGNG